MRGWVFLLGGLLIWTMHFFTLYAAASIFLTSTISRIITLIVTAACLAADALLIWYTVPKLRAGIEDETNRWMVLIAALGAAISFVAVLWQGLPALLI